ncbi:MAG: M2 family metallopeptidase [Myxococcales bacterium]
MRVHWGLLGLLTLTSMGCGCGGDKAARGVATRDAGAKLDAQASTANIPKASEAHAFVESTDRELRRLVVAASEADWEKSTNITEGTEQAAAKANEAVMAFMSKAIRDSVRFRDVPDIDPRDARQLELLRRGASLPAPDDPAKREELANIAAKMESLYGKGKYCKGDKPEDCRDLEELTDLFAKSHDYDALYDAWQGWHQIGKEIRPLYTRYVELANEGARTIGYRDLGDLWRSRYDMSAQEFSDVAARLYDQVSPLYKALHCHVRARLVKIYGKEKVPEDGLIPAHLLGNMWAQEWGNLYWNLEPFAGQGELDVTPALVKQKYDEVRMVKLGEAFFVSVGLPLLPETFWQRSMFKKPKGREVVCHASAWDVNYNDDLRIKMCIKINQDDLITIHHELGHDYYFSQYYTLPMLFQDGAHDGFHEAIGDAIALSITPAYLKQVGLLKSVSNNEQGMLNQLMQDALEKVAFLPFGKLIDEWRWKVFSGEIPPERYNRAWWELRAKYQGVGPAQPRGEEYFDPGAKYHIPANVPYTRYFLATVLQYQFHRAMCRLAGHEGPLYTCSIYGNKAAGEKLKQMLALGAQKPWPDALEVLTGQREMDASAILDYYQPLLDWLNKQNEGRHCGW